MTTDVLEQLGIITGIGGVALGVFLLLFREVIRKNIFPTLTKKQSFIIIQTFMLFVWLVGIIGIASYVYLKMHTPDYAIPTNISKDDATVSGCCDYWDIRKADITDDLKKNMLHIVDLVRNEKYQEADDELSMLPDSEEISKQFKRDYKTAILFGEGKYRDALISVLKRYEGLPISDVRYRWDIAYITYYLRRKEGVDIAEQTIIDLREEYKRQDLSLVWMGIHPRAHERLMSGDLYPYQTLHPKQIKILNYVISEHPNDPFIDHAYYFKKDYDRIIRDYPNSLIIDRAYYSRAYLPYYKLNRDSSLITVGLIDKVDGYFEEFIDTFKDSDLREEALKKQAMLQKHRKNVSHAFSRMLTIRAKAKKPTNLNYIIYSHIERQPTKVAQELANKIEVADKLNSHTLNRIIALKYFNDRDYKNSLTYYSKYVKHKQIGEGEKRRVDAIKAAARSDIRTLSQDELLNMSLLFKRTRSAADHAVPYLDRFIEISASNEEKAKALILKAFCYRDAEKPTEMRREFIRIVSEFPDSQFADDAMAELGVPYLLWGRPRPQKAIEYFRRVIEEYPKANAVDNSYNWIAYTHLKERNCLEAQKAYKYIEGRFPLTRFAKYAERNLAKINKMKKSTSKYFGCKDV